MCPLPPSCQDPVLLATFQKLPGSPILLPGAAPCSEQWAGGVGHDEVPHSLSFPFRHCPSSENCHLCTYTSPGMGAGGWGQESPFWQNHLSSAHTAAHTLALPALHSVQATVLNVTLGLWRRPSHWAPPVSGAAPLRCLSPAFLCLHRKPPPSPAWAWGIPAEQRVPLFMRSEAGTGPSGRQQEGRARWGKRAEWVEETTAQIPGPCQQKTG